MGKTAEKINKIANTIEQEQKVETPDNTINSKNITNKSGQVINIDGNPIVYAVDTFEFLYGLRQVYIYRSDSIIMLTPNGVGDTNVSRIVNENQRGKNF